MHLPGGTTQPLPAPWTVRQTEYTAVGPPAMPGDLPATSGYTYAAELSIDEAEAAGAESVELTPPDASTPPAVNYVENFIGAPVGTNVPTGAYDRDGRGVGGGAGRSRREGDLGDRRDGRSRHRRRRRQRRRRLPRGAEAHRRRAHGARAALRARRRAAARPDPAPVAVGPQLAVLAAAGLRAPKLGPDGRPLPDMCQQGGSSTIDCEDQNLREAVHVAGTPYELSYSSGWARDAAQRSIDVASHRRRRCRPAWSPSSSRSRSRAAISAIAGPTRPARRRERRCRRSCRT